MLTGFAGYSGNRGVGWVERLGKLWVVGYGEIRLKGRERGRGGGVGGVVRFVYVEGGVQGCQLLDDSL